MAYLNELENYRIATQSGGAPMPRPAEPEPSVSLDCLLSEKQTCMFIL
ncbi:unnamed protein product [Dibothriocephalus latus]|uniref:Uncharacterized protein n=1 Tax=Dibothriocephalus latus TaxID=60516 RepID=A0A3P6SNX1_DIBLA|nr:unnamed protein product [Dibothriocephalus latus]